MLAILAEDRALTLGEGVKKAGRKAGPREGEASTASPRFFRGGTGMSSDLVIAAGKNSQSYCYSVALTLTLNQAPDFVKPIWRAGFAFGGGEVVT